MYSEVPRANDLLRLRISALDRFPLCLLQARNVFILTRNARQKQHEASRYTYPKNVSTNEWLEISFLPCINYLKAGQMFEDTVFCMELTITERTRKKE